MAYFKSIFLFVLVTQCILRAKCAPKTNRPAVAHLKNTLVELDVSQQLASNAMTALRKSLGYGPFPYQPCSLDTSMMYKRVPLKQNTLAGHLTRLQKVLDPLIHATGNGWEKNLTLLNTQTRIAVKNASFGVVKGRYQIFIVDQSIHSTPLVKYRSSVLDKQIQEYMKCASISSSPVAVAILRYATFVKSLQLAMNSQEMQNDIAFLKTY